MAIKINLAHLPPSGLQIRCPSCFHQFHHTPGQEIAALPEPQMEIEDFDEFEAPAEPSRPSQVSLSRSSSDLTAASEAIMNELSDFYDELSDGPEAPQASAEPVEDGETRYHLKTADGRELGILRVSELNAMLDHGELSGNESLSPDGAFWSPMLDWPEFRQRLLKAGVSAVEEPPRSSAPSPAQGPMAFVLDDDDDDDDDDDLEEWEFEYIAPTTTAEARSVGMESPVDSTEFDDEEEEEAPLVSPSGELTVRRQTGNIRTALREEVIGTEVEDSGGRSKLVAIVAVLVLLLGGGGAYYTFFTDSSGGSQGTTTTQQRFLFSMLTPFAKDSVTSIIRRQLPRVEGKIRQYPRNFSLKITRALYMSFILELHGPDERFSKLVKDTVTQVKSYVKVNKNNLETHWLKGMFSLYFDRGRFAVKEGQGVLRFSSRHLGGLYLVGRGYCMRRRYRLGLRYLDRILKRTRRHTRALYAKGDCHSKLKQWSQAYRAFSDALVINPNHLPTLLGIIALDGKVPNEEGKFKILLSRLKRLMINESNTRFQRDYHLLLAQRAKRLGQARKSVTELKEALSYDPKNRKLLRLLPRYYFATQDYQLILDFLNKRLKRRATAPNALLFLRILYRSNQFKKALLAGKRFVLLFPKNTNILYMFGRIQEAMKNRKQAVEYYDRALKRNTKNGAAMLGLARITYRAGNLKFAKKSLNNALKLQAEDKDTLLGLAELRLMMKQPNKAILALKKVVEQSDDEIAHRMLGQSYLTLKTYTKARTHFLRSLQVLPKDSISLQGLANALEGLGQLSLAYHVLQLLLQERPDNSTISMRLGKLAYLMKRYKTATLWFNQTNRQAGNIGDSYYYLARIQEKTGQRAVSARITNYQSAIVNDKRNIQYKYRLARLYKERRNASAAIRQYNQLLSSPLLTRTQMTEIVFERGKQHYFLQNWRQALLDFTAYQKVDRGNKSLPRWLGDVYRQLQRYKQALRWYRKALKVVSSERERGYLHYQIAEVYYNQGASVRRSRRSSYRAIRYYKRALKSNPNLIDIYKKLGYLYKDNTRWGSCIRYFRRYLKMIRPSALDYTEVASDLRDCRISRSGR
jgi:tetratricopeptide (TPR) repeat protein